MCLSVQEVLVLIVTLLGFSFKSLALNCYDFCLNVMVGLAIQKVKILLLHYLMQPHPVVFLA